MTEQEVKDLYDQSIGEGNGFYSSQSSKVSNNIRNLVMGIIAVIWVVSYDRGVFILPNTPLIIAMFSCFGYLVVDILHYFLDSRFYYRKLLSLEENFGKEEYLKEYNNSLIKHSKLSYSWIWVKVVMFVIISFLFIFGMYKHLL